MPSLASSLSVLRCWRIAKAADACCRLLDPGKPPAGERLGLADIDQLFQRSLMEDRQKRSRTIGRKGLLDRGSALASDVASLYEAVRWVLFGNR